MIVKQKRSKDLNDIQPPWWDAECEALKQRKYALLRLFRLTNLQSDLINYKTNRNAFKNMCKQKKIQYEKLKRDELLNSRKNPSLFWKTIKQCNVKPCSDNSISEKDWLNYFKNLLYTEDSSNYNSEELSQYVALDNNDALNSPITTAEIITGIHKLKSGKSAGPCGIGAEFFKHTESEIAPILNVLFNNILNTGIYPDTWADSILCPIHKSGSKNEPGNYRGISLISIMYKIFSHVATNRIYNWAERESKIDEAQAGFRKGYSAVDNIFSLQSMAQKYLSKKGGRFYCLYVDFSKAFDSLIHEKLFRSIARKGITGKLLNVFISMYSKTKACVRTTNGLTESFSCNIGTRQGDKSSPILFSLYLCTLLRERCGSGVFITNDISDILCLLFADDVTHVAETASKLQIQLNVLHEFCATSGMAINLKKTEIIVFRNGGRLRLYENWAYEGNRVNVTSFL